MTSDTDHCAAHTRRLRLSDGLELPPGTVLWECSACAGRVPGQPARASGATIRCSPSTRCTRQAEAAGTCSLDTHSGDQTPAHTRIRVACFAYVSEFAIFKFRPFRFSLFATCFHMHCITQHGKEDRLHKACTFVERSGQPCAQNSDMPGSVDASHPL